MNASNQTAQSSTPAYRGVPEGLRETLSPALDDDMAIGCECANPVLQIELWGHEVFAPPLQRLA